jgi:hypothetical protein
MYLCCIHKLNVIHILPRFRKKKKKKSKAEEVVETVEKVEAKLSQTTESRTPAQIAHDKIQEQRVSSPLASSPALLI